MTETRSERVKQWWQRRWRVLLLCAGCLLLGAFVRGFLPPFVLDDEFWRGFWRDFLTGPPAAGVFAVAAAGVAYLAASFAARGARAAARRQEWWNRAEWALTLARSNDEVDRKVGLAALGPMRDEATRTEEAIIVAVTSAVAGEDEDSGGVDTPTGVADNGGRQWRWFGWLKKRR